MGCCCKKSTGNKKGENTIPTLQDLDDGLIPTDDSAIMGRESTATYYSTSSTTSKDPNATLDDFERLKVLGKGSFGKVILVRLKTNGKLFAMKILKKEAVIKRKQVDHTKTERMILEKLRHPFIVRLYYAFQDQDNLYFITEFMQGGEMFFHLHRNPQYKDKAVIFYLSEILLALEYMHRKNIIYRDLKPENILLDFQGHIKLTDFGLSKILSYERNRTYTMCGTAEYLAPEIILDKEGYDKSCDWFSFGALMFEMLCGHHPFPRKGKKIDPRIYMSPIKIPRYLTDDARNLLGKLLEVNPRKRIGFNGAEEIRKHPYFKDIDFEKVFAKAYTPPFVPKLKEETDLKYFDPGFTSEEVDSFKDNDLAHKQNPDFEGFTYQPEEMVEEEDQNYDVEVEDFADSLKLSISDKLKIEGDNYKDKDDDKND